MTHSFNFKSTFFCSKYVFAESISKAWIGLARQNEQEGNVHLNNLLESTSTNTANEWIIDCNHGVWNQESSDVCSNWYGWSYDMEQSKDVIGSISTTFNGKGHAKLDFGNCFNSGSVHASLDGTEIASVPKDTPSKTVEFDFNDGSILKVTEENLAIIQFNSLDIIQCNEQESCTNNDHWKWISSNSHLTLEQLELFDEPKMHDDKPKRECAEIKWHPKSIIEARSCTVPHADGVICQIP